MSSSRVANSLKNVLAAWGGQAISVIGSFAVRAVFVSCLAQEYVGLESLFTSVLAILALADLGIGSAIVYSLYDPLAKDDRETVKSLMRLFKRAYILIGITIIVVGALLTPNIGVLLGEDAPDIPLLEVYFFCFVLNTGISYFFSYKGSLLYADQKGYLVYLIQYSFQIALSVVQIAVLLVTKNYLLFLFCMLASTLLQNICIAVTANRRYPYIKEKDVDRIDKVLLDDIKKNMFGLIIHRLAGVASTPVSNLVITVFINLTTTSLYGNYLLITNALTRIMDRLFDSIIASVGNLSVEASEDRQYEVFKTTLFINAISYAVISGGLLCSCNAFIAVLFGDNWLFPSYVVVFIVLMFYVKGLRSAGLAFTSAYGLFWYTKWKAVLEAVFLPLLAVILVQPLGIVGVFLASIISSLCISTVYEAWAVYRHGFHKPLRDYARLFSTYLVSGLGSIGLAFVLCEMLPVSGILAFLLKGLVGVCIPGAVYVALFGRSRECKECLSIFKRIGGKILAKSKRA